MPDITGKKTLRSVARTGMVAPVPPLLAWASLGTGFVIALAAVLRMAALAQSPLDVFPDKRGFWPGTNPLVGIDGALITT